MAPVSSVVSPGPAILQRSMHDGLEHSSSADVLTREIYGGASNVSTVVEPKPSPPRHMERYDISPYDLTALRGNTRDQGSQGVVVNDDMCDDPRVVTVIQLPTLDKYRCHMTFNGNLTEAPGGNTQALPGINTIIQALQMNAPALRVTQRVIEQQVVDPLYTTICGGHPEIAAAATLRTSMCAMVNLSGLHMSFKQLLPPPSLVAPIRRREEFTFIVEQPGPAIRRQCHDVVGSLPGTPAGQSAPLAYSCW